MIGNVIVGQSGGPTSVINSSLVGVYKTARDRGAKKVYGMLHGIKGLLDGQYVDLSEKIKTDIDIDLLKRTPHPTETRISHHAGDIEKIFPINRVSSQCFFQRLRNDD